MMTKVQCRLCVFAERAAQMAAAATHLAQEIFNRTQKTGTARVALAGGTTPAAMYPLLSTAHVGQGVYFMPTDERCVPMDHPRSNIGMLRLTLGGEHNILPLREGEAMSTTAKDGAESVAPQIILLGAGADGHIASLFADSPIDDQTERVQRVRPAGQPEERLTLPFAVLAQASFLLLLICGDDKFRLLGEPADGELPLTRLLVARQQLAKDTWVYYAP